MTAAHVGEKGRPTGPALPAAQQSDHHRRIVLGGCTAHLLSMEEAVSFIGQRSQRYHQAPPLGVISINLDHLHHFGAGTRLQPLFDDAERRGDIEWLPLLDGAPLVHQANRMTGGHWPRLAGSDLIGPLLDHADEHDLSVGFLGGSRETQCRLGLVLSSERPRLRVAGLWSPPRNVLDDPSGSRRLAAEIREAGADLLVVGLGKPRQEAWIAQYGASTGAHGLLGFGAVVDFIAGRLHRCPQWASERGLEWAWRLGLEPRRLAGRYLVQGPPAYLRLRQQSTLEQAAWAPAQKGVRGAGQAALKGRQRIPAQRGSARADGCFFVGSDRPADVVVLVVTHNNEEHIEGLIDSLRAQAGESRLRLIIADNGSTDATLARAAAADDVVSFSTGGNLGYAAGINAARRHAGAAEAQLILNADVVLEPGAIAAMRDRLAAPRVGAVVPRLVDPDGTTYVSLRREPTLLRALGDAALGSHISQRPTWLSEIDYDPDSYLHPHSVDWATGAALLVRSEVSDILGDWDERYFLYSEETDYLHRVRDAGLEVWYEPSAVVRHDRGGSGSSLMSTALMAVNRIRYVETRHTSPWVLTFRAIEVLAEALRSRERSHRLALRMLVNRDAWVGLPRAQTPIPDRQTPDCPSGSVVIPAHNEERVIARTLAPLVELSGSGRVEVIVCCNGCTDRTAEISRSFPSVTVVELPHASKVAALNAADEVACLWPRIYLDADIELPTRAVCDLFARLVERDDLMAARPPVRYDIDGAGVLLRSFSRARRRVHGNSPVLWGAGVYALTAAGHSRFSVFPDVTADDLFVDQLFNDAEKAVLDTWPATVRLPSDFAGLMAVLRRTQRGNRELAALGTVTYRRTTLATLTRLAQSIRSPGQAVDAVAYVALVMCSRVIARFDGSHSWERDDSRRGV